MPDRPAQPDRGLPHNWQWSAADVEAESLQYDQGELRGAFLRSHAEAVGLIEPADGAAAEELDEPDAAAAALEARQRIAAWLRRGGRTTVLSPDTTAHLEVDAIEVGVNVRRLPRVRTGVSARHEDLR